MMEVTDMDRMSEILEGLNKRTEEGKLTWRTGVGLDSFITSVDDIVIFIREEFDGRHRLSIVNDAGATARELQTPISLEDEQSEDDATPEQARELSRLFALARNSALKTDSTLEQLAKSLANY